MMKYTIILIMCCFLLLNIKKNYAAPISEMAYHQLIDNINCAYAQFLIQHQDNLSLQQVYQNKFPSCPEYVPLMEFYKDRLSSMTENGMVAGMINAQKKSYNATYSDSLLYVEGIQPIFTDMAIDDFRKKYPIPDNVYQDFVFGLQQKILNQLDLPISMADRVFEPTPSTKSTAKKSTWATISTRLYNLLVYWWLPLVIIMGTGLTYFGSKLYAQYKAGELQKPEPKEILKQEKKKFLFPKLRPTKNKTAPVVQKEEAVEVTKVPTGEHKKDENKEEKSDKAEEESGTPTAFSLNRRQIFSGDVEEEEDPFSEVPPNKHIPKIIELNPADVSHRIFYMPQPSVDGSFYEFKKTDKYQKEYSLYKFEVISEKYQLARFYVVNTQEVVTQGIMDFERYLHPACKSQNSFTPTSTEIITVKPGVVQRSTNHWRLKQKAVIRFKG